MELHWGLCNQRITCSVEDIYLLPKKQHPMPGVFLLGSPETRRQRGLDASSITALSPVSPAFTAAHGFAFFQGCSWDHTTSLTSCSRLGAALKNFWTWTCGFRSLRRLDRRRREASGDSMVCLHKFGFLVWFSHPKKQIHEQKLFLLGTKFLATFYMTTA